MNNLEIAGSHSHSINKNQVYLFSINAALGAVFFGYVMGIFNPLQNTLRLGIYPHVPDSIFFMMTSLVPVGAAIGSLLSGKVASVHGRRDTMIYCDVVSSIGSILTLFQNEYFMLLGRFICGLCVGFNSSIVPLYLTEISPIEMKGVTGTFNQVFVSVGILLAYLLGLGLPADPKEPSSYWRFLLAVPVVITMARSFNLAVFFKYDTPKFSIIKGREEEARRVLTQIYNWERSTQELITLKRFKDEETSKLTYGDLLRYNLRKRLLIGCGLSLLQQFSGINAIIFYSTAIFSQGITDPNDSRPLMYTMGVGVVNLLSAFISTALISQIGRKKLLLVGCGVLAASLLGLASVDISSGSAKLLIYIYILGFGFSLGSITWIYIAEILPDLGIGIAVMLNWCTCILVAQTFPSLVDEYGVGPIFFVFSMICVAGLGFIFSCVKETKGKDAQEINNLYNDHRKDSDEIDLLKKRRSF